MIASFFLLFVIVFSTVTITAYAQQSTVMPEEYCEKNWRELPEESCPNFPPTGYYEEVASKGDLTQADIIELDKLKASVFGSVNCPVGYHQKAINSEITCVGNVDPTKTIAPIELGNLNSLDFSNVDSGLVLSVVVGIIIIFIIVGIAKDYANRYPIMPPDVEHGLNNNFSGWDDYKFENLIADIYNRLGYHAEVTPRGPDQGVDVIAEKGNERIIIQAKRWISNVGSPEVRETVGAMSMHHATKSAVITPSDFTSSANKVEEGTPNLELINMEKLRKIILKAYRHSK